MTNQTAKRIGAGEYTYKGWDISKDEYEANLWWASKADYRTDFATLKDAKRFIDQQEPWYHHPVYSA